MAVLNLVNLLLDLLLDNKILNFSGICSGFSSKKEKAPV